MPHGEEALQPYSRGGWSTKIWRRSTGAHLWTSVDDRYKKTVAAAYGYTGGIGIAARLSLAETSALATEDTLR